MKYITLKYNNEIICEKAYIADDMFSRMKGLMFSKKIPFGDGILIKKCNSIHTFFMNYPIDIIFLGKDFSIKKVIRNIPPWRATKIYFNSYQVLELMGNTLPENMKTGDQLEAICIN